MRDTRDVSTCPPGQFRRLLGPLNFDKSRRNHVFDYLPTAGSAAQTQEPKRYRPFTLFVFFSWSVPLNHRGSKRPPSLRSFRLTRSANRPVRVSHGSRVGFLDVHSYPNCRMGSEAKYSTSLMSLRDNSLSHPLACPFRKNPFATRGCCRRSSI